MRLLPMRSLATLAARAATVLVCLAWIASPTHSAARPGYGPAILGAPLTDWIHRFGPYMRNSSASEPTWRPCPNDPKSGRLLVTFSSGKAVLIMSSHCGMGPRPTPAQNRTAARPFMPSDAAHAVSVTTGTAKAEEYYSAALAKTEPSDQATDCNFNPVRRGLFLLHLDYLESGDWALSFGTCV